MIAIATQQQVEIISDSRQSEKDESVQNAMGILLLVHDIQNGDPQTQREQIALVAGTIDQDIVNSSPNFVASVR